MNLKNTLKTPRGKFAAFIVAYLLVALVLYWVVADDWTRTMVETDSVTMSQLLPEDAKVEQTFTAKMDALESLGVTPHFNTAEHAGGIRIALYEGDTLLTEQTVDAATLMTDTVNQIMLETPVQGINGKTLTLQLEPQGTGLALWAGNSVNTGKFDIAVSTAGLTVNGVATEGQLVLVTRGYNNLKAASVYWYVAAVLLAVCIVVWLRTVKAQQTGKRTVLTVLLMLCDKYRFLLKQLVSRDFRVKYKASALGVLWSFLNPLLTMMVYLVVFSTIFRSDIEYFPVYLMSGIILFNYFSESTSLGLSSISGNGALITKVYMPKVIYPLSKVLSSGINLCISFIPLLIVMLLTGVPFHKSMLLLPLVVLFLMGFCMGMSLILSTMNVFFRDTQFLWGILVTMWNFLTPIFYPESIIPAQLTGLYHLNPLYQIVFFMRSITIGGVSPTPVTYLYCTLASLMPLALGLWIFRKNQDKFVLYL